MGTVGFPVAFFAGLGIMAVVGAAVNGLKDAFEAVDETEMGEAPKSSIFFFRNWFNFACLRLQRRRKGDIELGSDSNEN